MKALIVEYSKMNGFGGGIYFARSVINWTAAVADEVTLLYPSDDGRSDPELNPSVRLIPVKDSSSNRLRRLLRMVRTGHLHRFDIPFRALLSRQKFDLIVFHNSKGRMRHENPGHGLLRSMTTMSMTIRKTACPGICVPFCCRRLSALKEKPFWEVISIWLCLRLMPGYFGKRTGSRRSAGLRSWAYRNTGTVSFPLFPMWTSRFLS